ncbi:hypothetical protein PCASD_18272 [Puccinia coronata f. sp. avenae]|uniref:Uncharacterized protein n=1 Tax=Puccinia coronata f. sp. avenae TaxID=200324 RepID=A0A2N5SP05_9BASI|nr:hypothetical protein PCASD_18272 [Puccinia coronata f. sp. avenae]
MCVSGSHKFSAGPKPFQLTKYSLLFPLFLQSRISSTSHSASPFTSTGAGVFWCRCSIGSGWFFRSTDTWNTGTAGINRSNTAARAVLEQPCSTGGRTDTVRPKREPTGRTDLSDRSRLVLCNRSQELIGQACPTRRQVLRSDSACPTTGRTRLFEHRSNCRVRPVNAGSVDEPRA